jgi:hypothetical protein
LSQDDYKFEISEKTLKKILEAKTIQGFDDKTWDEWFDALLQSPNYDVSDKEIIENIIRKNALNVWYGEWVTNFSLNLENIWKDNSASELIKQQNSKFAIVIGRGPSIKKNNHLEILAKSNFGGAIICADGALPNVLRAGITPDKFNLFTLTIDAQENQKKLYEEPITKKLGKDVKCILSTTANPNVYMEAKKSGLKIYWIHTLFDYDENKRSFNKIQGIMSKAKNKDKKIPAIQTGANVGTSAWVVAWSILRCKHVGLIGMDMGYDGNTPWNEINYHGNPIPKDIDPESMSFKRAYTTVYNPDFDCYCKQDPLFLYYCNALKEFIKKTQHDIETINATEGGALYGEGIKCMKLKDFLHYAIK